MKNRIMYIEHKGELSGGPARIGRVSFSKSGSSLYYRGKTFRTLEGKGGPAKANYFDVDSGDEYWISGCKREGGDRLYDERVTVEIDEDVREEYWKEIRREPESTNKSVAN